MGFQNSVSRPAYIHTRVSVARRTESKTIESESVLKKYNVLVTDDDQRIVDFLRIRLKSAGYEVSTAADGLQAIDKIRVEEPDIILLDLNMPIMNGIETMRELRTFSSTPVIMLTAHGEDDEIVRGLRLGADDYLAKPFNPDELVARIESIRRRMEIHEKGKNACGVFVHGSVTIDLNQRVLTVGGNEKQLTRIEWLLLIELEQNAGRFMTYEEMLGRIWGSEYHGDVQLLRTWISRLRHKLQNEPGDPQVIETIPGCGYMMKHAAAW